MRSILVDSSVWIAYFRGDKTVSLMDELLSEGALCTNEIIMTELIPYLSHRKNVELVDLLSSVPRIPLSTDWEEIRELQLVNLRKGVNKVGIPDLVILQQVLQTDRQILSLDRHFTLMAEKHGKGKNLFRIQKKNGDVM